MTSVNYEELQEQGDQGRPRLISKLTRARGMGKIHQKTMLEKLEEIDINTLEDVVNICRNTKYESAIIRYYYYTEFRKEAPWGVLKQEIRKAVNLRVKEIEKGLELSNNHTKTAFNYTTGNAEGGRTFTWEYLFETILGQRYSKGSRSGLGRGILGFKHYIPIQDSWYEAPARVILEGLEVNATQVRTYYYLYPKKKIGLGTPHAKRLTDPVKNPHWLILEKGVVRLPTEKDVKGEYKNKYNTKKVMDFIHGKLEEKDVKKKWEKWKNDECNIRTPFFNE